LETAKRLLADPCASIKEIADVCGYEDALYFWRLSGGISARRRPVCGKCCR
jgi:AraC-like DNA-binding protein